MERNLLVVLAGVVLFAGCRDRNEAPAGPGADEAALLVAPGARDDRVRVIIEVRSASDRGPVADQAMAAGGRLHRAYRRFPMVAVEVPRATLTGLQRSPRVRAIHEDVADVPMLTSSLPVIGAPQVHADGYEGQGYAVAILDTGIDRNHPLFAGRVIREACFSSAQTGGESLCPNGQSEQIGPGAANIETERCRADDGRNICDHGPHVAGIAAGGLASLRGVAPAADIIAIQVFSRTRTCPATGSCVSSFVSDQIAALEWLLDMVDFEGVSLASANMSLGSVDTFSPPCDSDPRKAAVDQLRSRGIATVTSAGNSGSLGGLGRPACISTVVAVGATDNDDLVAGFSNRASALALFAPGVDILSAASTAEGGFDTKSGTSMASPHVAGAWALMRQRDPGASVDDILGRLRETGLPITYVVGSTQVTTPRLDLHAAFYRQPPTGDLSANHPRVAVLEGLVARAEGTVVQPAIDPYSLFASIGEIEYRFPDRWVWSFPTVDGPTESQTVTIRAVNTGQALETTFELVVINQPPVITRLTGVATIDEGGSVTLQAEFEDPGGNDGPFTAEVECWSNAAPGFSMVVTAVVEADGNAGTARATCPYGDTSTPAGATSNQHLFAQFRITDKDGGTGVRSGGNLVHNVDPSVSLVVDAPTAEIAGRTVILAQPGEAVEFRARVTDPGSDDLHLTWDMGDGTEYTLVSWADPSRPDPFPSPSIGPRDITDVRSHAFTQPCIAPMRLAAVDDDGGEGEAGAMVFVRTPTGARVRGAGYWLTHMRENRSTDFDDATLLCYLGVAGFFSDIFDELREATVSLEAAADVLHVPGSGGEMSRRVDRELLAAWLNYANGAFEWDDLVDTTGNRRPDTPFSQAILTAEAVRTNPGATRAQLEAQRRILEAINLMHGG